MSSTPHSINSQCRSFSEVDNGQYRTIWFASLIASSMNEAKMNIVWVVCVCVIMGSRIESVKTGERNERENTVLYMHSTTSVSAFNLVWDSLRHDGVPNTLS